MIHEFKEIVQQAAVNQKKGLKSVLATVVDLEGSSYRKPGVRMLISENLKAIGAVSGGCVENEIIQRSKSVFFDKKAKIITYDGRYRLGCEGILYLLIEPFFVSETFLEAFSMAISNRKALEIETTFIKKDNEMGHFGSKIKFDNKKFFFFSENTQNIEKNDFSVFYQKLKPAFKLIIFGGEHDAVKLCQSAAQVGWEVLVVTSAKDSKNVVDFPGATAVIGEIPETLQLTDVDSNTAFVIMNHSYVQDLKYLIKLTEFTPKYIGILGASNRRERLFNELLEYVPDVSDTFFDRIFTPAGLYLNAATPEEISISILAEILAVINQTMPISLRNHTGKNHK